MEGSDDEMGYMRHHAIVVSSWDEDLLIAARDTALRIFPAVTEIVGSATNGYKSFLVPPDGSKEGWPESKRGDYDREAFKDALRAKFTYEDGSSSLGWAEVQFGDDDYETLITDDSDAGRRMQPSGEPRVERTIVFTSADGEEHSIAVSVPTAVADSMTARFLPTGEPSE